MIIFWKPVPRSSQIPYRLKFEAKDSLRDSGLVPINRSIFLLGSNLPGFVNSILSSKISIVGPVPVIVKSWCIRVLAINSRSAISG